MTANIDKSNGRNNIAFLGSRQDVWHHMGQEMPEGATIEQWAQAAGLNYDVIKFKAFAQLEDGEMREINNRKYLFRNDTMKPVGYASNNFKLDGIQPRGLLEWFQKCVLTDNRFKIDVAGALHGGSIVWATAVFQDDIEIMGEVHRARLLMTTAYNTTLATTNQCTMTRVVCNNTLAAALFDKKAVIKTGHGAAFNPEKVAAELATVAASVGQYKKMAEGLARVRMSKDTVEVFFKKLLRIDASADVFNENEVATRTRNIFVTLQDAYSQTVDEGTEKETVWTALNAVTRYVDNDRAVKQGRLGAVPNSKDVARFLSANFGSGNDMKAQAFNMLKKYEEENPVRGSVPVSASLMQAAMNA